MSKKTKLNDQAPKYSLDDIIGYQDEKDELLIALKSIEMMNSQDTHQGYRPHGIALAGDPGVGKTLFAKVLINSAKVPSYIIDGTALHGSVGKVCHQINQTFKKAKKNPVSIIFIDEVHRLVNGYGFGGYNSDLSRSILSCLLTNLDGLQKSENVFLVLTCEDIRDLDPALVRPGRIDKIIDFALPNAKEREELFDYYISKQPALKDLKLDTPSYAVKTIGFSCAGIRTVVAEAALLYEQNPKADLEQIFVERILSSKGGKKSSNISLNEEEILRTCIHELGHAVAMYERSKSWPDVTISPNLKTNALGLTFYTEDEDQSYRSITPAVLLEYLAVDLGGYAAELTFYKNTSTGCNGDISDACREILNATNAGIYGLEYIDFQFMADPLNGAPGICSDKLLSKQEKLYQELLKEGEKHAIQLIEKYKAFIEHVAPILKTKQILSAQTLENLYNDFIETKGESHDNN